MNLFVPNRRFDRAKPEMIDGDDNDPVLLEQDLSNLRTINRFFGGLSAMRDALPRFLERVPPSRTAEILDLATGSADHPVEIVGLARKMKRLVRIVAVDRNPQILEIARKYTEGYSEISLVRKDLRHLDFGDKSFDIVLCSLAIHHFSNEDAVAILREMHRLSRVGFMVNDLERSWIGAWTAWLYTHATTRNPLTLNDSCLSVLRAFTPDELRDIALQAKVQNFQVYRKPFFRLILVAAHRTE
ncbi:MAG: methyltransferase domain-containing protein [Ignavibacteriales bacterium]|nr:methyltransferase domain-containing protein [Ignavibacteriales bacterium]